MASLFKSYGSAAIGTSLATLYTAPGSTTSTVIGLSVANVTASTIIAVDVILVKGGVTSYYLVKGAPIIAGGALVVVGGDQKVVLQTTDVLKIISDVAASCDAVVSVLEVS
jgi:hypothetical protein